MPISALVRRPLVAAGCQAGGPDTSVPASDRGGAPRCLEALSSGAPAAADALAVVRFSELASLVSMAKRRPIRPR